MGKLGLTSTQKTRLGVPIEVSLDVEHDHRAGKRRFEKVDSSRNNISAFERGKLQGEVPTADTKAPQ